MQRHILNLQPDLLICARHHGATVIEVKDWTPGRYRARGGWLEVCDPSGDWWPSREDPILQVHRYRQRVANVLVSPPGDNEFPAVRGAVVVLRFDDAEIRSLLTGTTRLDPRHQPWVGIAGSAAMRDDDAGWQLAFGGSRRARGLSESTFERMLSRLREPEVIAEQRRCLVLSTGAQNVAQNPNNARTRRVRGPAGSGKTLGLAARAASLAAEGKSVLLLTFNITLAHYAQDLVRRQARSLGADHRRVDCIHFHGFCTEVKAGIDGPVETARDGLEPDEILFEQARGAYLSHANVLPRYDAVLVDEGQDFRAEWWQFLRQHVCEPDGEMVLAADTTQDIYDRAGWTAEESMRQCGFSGRWAELDGCYRLPPDLIPILKEFAEQFLARYDVSVPTEPEDRNGLAAAPTTRRWVNLDSWQLGPDGLVSAPVEEVINLLDQPDAPHPADVAVLSNNHSTGARVMQELAVRGRHVESIFDVDKDDRRGRKVRFWPGANAIKGSTVHSFKGWESRGVVVLIEPGHDTQDTDAVLAYVALSRVKGEPLDRPAFVTVVNAAAPFNHFKQRFERSVAPDEVPALAGQLALTADASTRTVLDARGAPSQAVPEP